MEAKEHGWANITWNAARLPDAAAPLHKEHPICIKEGVQCDSYHCRLKQEAFGTVQKVPSIEGHTA